MHQSLMHQDSETRSAKKVNQTELNGQKNFMKLKKIANWKKEYLFISAY